MKRAEDASGMADIYANNNEERAWTVINTNLSIVASALLMSAVHRQLP